MGCPRHPSDGLQPAYIYAACATRRISPSSSCFGSPAWPRSCSPSTLSWAATRFHLPAESPWAVDGQRHSVLYRSPKRWPSGGRPAEIGQSGCLVGGKGGARISAPTGRREPPGRRLPKRTGISGANEQDLPTKKFDRREPVLNHGAPNVPTIPTYWLVDWAIIAGAMLLAALLTAIVAV